MRTHSVEKIPVEFDNSLRFRAVRLLTILAAAATSTLCMAAPAHADEDQGPSLRASETEMAAALNCPANFDSGRDPVLLVHGTSSNPEENWDWSYGKLLPQLGYDVCTVTLPGYSLGDIQDSTEYVVHAIREIAQRSDMKVDIIGHSQGTLHPRWALRFWPDLRNLVDDVVQLAAPNHGTVASNIVCALPIKCSPAAWQMSQGSQFMTALNATGRAEPGASFSSIYSTTDELVQPGAPGTGEPTAVLTDAANIAIQEVCPGRWVTHAGMVADAMVLHLVRDALDNSGPVDSQRIDPRLCAEAIAFGLDPIQDGVGNTGRIYVDGWLRTLTGDKVQSEPPLRDYAR